VVVYFHALHLQEDRGDDFFLHHHPGWRASLAHGVEIFFVISGFIISTVAARESSALIFFLKRAWKIIPVYYAMTAYQYWFLWDEGKTPPLERLLHSLLFIRKSTPPVLIQGWTLNYEMTFYAATAMLILCKLRPLGIFAAVAMLALAHGWLVYFSLFAAGCLLGELSKRITLPNWTGAVMLLVALALWAWRATEGDAFGPSFDWDRAPGGISWRLSRSAPYAILLVAAAVLPQWRSAPMPKLLVFLGDASYPIYICQQFGLVWASRNLQFLPGPLFSLGGALTCIVIGTLVHLCWEQPFAKAWTKVYDLFPLLRPLPRAAPGTAA
jgi:exopolysaccharide production protein ExoZ